MGQATPANRRKPDPPKVARNRQLAAKTRNSRRPPQATARNHNPKAVGSSPSSGMTAALVLFVHSAQSQGMSQASPVPITTLTAMPSRSTE
jgi:hypothetical protein